MAAFFEHEGTTSCCRSNMERPKREKKPSVHALENKEYEEEILKTKKRKTVSPKPEEYSSIQHVLTFTQANRKEDRSRGTRAISMSSIHNHMFR